MQRSLLIRTLMLTDSNFNVNDDDGASFMLILMFQLPHPQERGDAEELAKKVRVLCWVMTGPDNHKTKAAHVKVPDSPAMCFVVLLSFPTNVIAGNLGKALQQTPLHEFERGQGPLHIS